MTSSQHSGSQLPSYRMITLRQQPGGRTAGNGLPASDRWRHSRRNPTLLTCRAQAPTLPTETVVSAPPQHSGPGHDEHRRAELVTASRPASAWPDTATSCGPAGSVLSIVIVAEKLPGPLGWKRRGTASASPLPMTSG